MVCTVGQGQNQQNVSLELPTPTRTASCRLPCLQKLPFVFWWEMSGPALLWPIAEGIRLSGVLLWTIRQRGKTTDTVFLTRAIGQKGKGPSSPAWIQPLPEELGAQSPSALWGLFCPAPTRLYLDEALCSHTAGL